MRNETPIYLFLLGVFLIIISPSLLTHGMFMDGMIYATVAKNMADGLGTFWQPYFTATCYPEFFEHPPLAMGIQSILYRVFGDSFLIEKLYSFSTWLLVAVGMVQIWKHFQLKNAWLPIFILLTVSRIIWASTNNGLENTLAVLLIFALLFYLKSLKNQRYLMLSGVFVAAAFLTKGPFGLFIWGLPFFYESIVERKNIFVALLSSVKLIFWSVLPLVLLYSSSDSAWNNLTNYYEVQVLDSIKNIETVESRWFIVRYLLAELILPLSIVAIVLWIVWKKWRQLLPDTRHKRLALTFLVCALGGVLPIMISMKQSGFYILPTFPIFALGLAFLIEKSVATWMKNANLITESKNFFTYPGISALLVGIALNLTAYGGFDRDEDKLQDMHRIVAKLQEEIAKTPEIGAIQVLGVSEELWNNWSIQAYFQRYYGIALDPNDIQEHAYILVEDGRVPDDVGFAIERITSNTQRYHLFKNIFAE